MAKREPSESRLVKTSVLVDAKTYALWAACAALKGQSRYAFAAEAIRVACSGIVVVDRRKPAGRVVESDRLAVAGEITPDGPESAA